MTPYSACNSTELGSIPHVHFFFFQAAMQALALRVSYCCAPKLVTAVGEQACRRMHSFALLAC